MAEPVILPKCGQTVEACVLGEWKKKVGEEVKAGETLFTFETDKAVFDGTAERDGVLLAILYPEGAEVPVLSCVAVIGAPGDDISAWSVEVSEKALPEEPAGGVQKEKPDAVSRENVCAAPQGFSERHIASPRARRLAEKLDVDLSEVAASGAENRIISADIVAAAARSTHAARLSGAVGVSGGTGVSGRVRTADLIADTKAECASPAAGAARPEEDFEDIPVGRVRKMTAEAMHRSLATAAQLTHMQKFDATALVSLHQTLTRAAAGSDAPKITYGDIILFVVSRVLTRYPDFNAHYLDTVIRRFRHVNLGIAVDTHRGLLVPTLPCAEGKTLSAIASEGRKLIEDVRNGRMEAAPASITVSNLGNVGTEFFTPVLNVPQVAILGVGSIHEQARRRGGEIEFYPAIGLSLTYDHRAADGLPASKLLAELCRTLEELPAALAF